MNPYDWQSHNPTVRIPRAEVDRAAETLLRGGSAVVLGGRGMGKSVFLAQLQETLEQTPDLGVLLVPAPPPELTVRACLDLLAEVLSVPDGAIASQKLFEAYFAREDAPERLILLFDELDRYAGGSGSSDPPGRGFFNDLEASRRALPSLAIAATGSIGIFVFRDSLGSSFLARALQLRLSSFDHSVAAKLAEPFRERGAPLAEEVLDALQLASGGIPALLTYGLQSLWDLSREASERDVVGVYARFEDEHDEYLRDLTSSLAEPRLSEAPLRVWERIRNEPGPIPRPVLEEAVGAPTGALKLDLVDVLRLLQAVGAVRVEGSLVSDDPVKAYPITGLLNLPKASPPAGGVRQELLRDLRTLLEKLHRSSADFFRPQSQAEGKRLVPESVFAAHLALGFELLGWRCEREAQSAAGRTDLVMRRNGSRQVAVVEVKIWGRHDYREAHHQVESYWTSEVVAGAVVQLTDAELPDWPERYRRECLEPCGADVERHPMADSPIRARFDCTSNTADGVAVSIGHFLLRLPRRS